MVSVTERMRSYLRGRGMTTGHRMDHYLTEHLPRLVREYELATQALVRPVDETLDRHHASVGDLERWHGAASQRLDMIKKRIGRLEVKHGLGGR